MRKSENRSTLFHAPFASDDANAKKGMVISVKIKRLFLIAICVILSLSALPISSSAAFSGDDRIVIVLDPGHGGKNIGTAAYNVGEKVYTLRIANMIKKHLDANGSFIVHMTRTGDYDLELCERGIYANDVNADALISLHFDGSTDKSQNGVTVYTSVFDKNALVQLGNSVSGKVAAAAGLASNGVKRKKDAAGFYWNSSRQWDIKDPSLGTLSDYYGIPTWGAKFGFKAMIVEHGFMTNPRDRDIIIADGTLEKMAAAEAEAIIAYYTGHTHTYGAMQQDYPSNCVFQGKQSEHCTVCGHRRNIQLLPAAPNNHYWENETTVPASCGHDGSVTKKCRITDNLIDKGYKKITQHQVTEVIPAPTQHNYKCTEDVPATHTTDGYKKYVCTNCSDTFRDIFKAEGHSYEKVSYTDPTCTEDGGTLYRCTGCTSEYTDSVPALGHKYTVTNEKLPSCTESGERTSECSVCKYVLNEELPAKGHNTSLTERTEPTCTADGSVKGKCPDCGTVLDEVIEKTGHKLEDKIIKEASCTENGKLIRTCTVCGETVEEITVPAAHEYLMSSYTEPECDSRGSTDFVCARCGKVFSSTLKATGHSWITESETEPKLFKAGERQLVCSVCGETDTVELHLGAGEYILYAVAAASVVCLTVAIALLIVFLIRSKKKASVCAEEDITDIDIPSADADETEAEVKVEVEVEAEAEAEVEVEVEVETDIDENITAE